MLFALSGPSSSGKSTIIGHFSEPRNRYCTVDVLKHHFAREVMNKMRITINDMKVSLDKTITYHFELYKYRFGIEEKYLHNNKTKFNTLIERSFVDSIIYFFLQLLPHNEEFNKEHDDGSIINLFYNYLNKFDYFQDYYNLCVNKTKEHYYKILYLSENPKIENDGIRISDLTFINNQKILFNEIFEKEFKDQLVIIDSLTMIDRLFDISRVLNKHYYYLENK